MKKQITVIAKAQRAYKSLTSFVVVKKCVETCDNDLSNLLPVVVKYAKKYNLA
jgi:hypothetical protein